MNETTNTQDLSDKVLQTNLKFYESIADVYDGIDSRRKDNIQHEWFEAVLDKIQENIKSTALMDAVFLDAGAGSGFLSYRAEKRFKNIILQDLSQKMLDRINIPRAKKIAGDCTEIALPDNSVDAIGAFATMHHLYDPVRFFKEASRLLKPGGVLYTDHDIEKSFIKNLPYL